MDKFYDYYKTHYLSSGNYDCLVTCLSYESVFTFIDNLKNEFYDKKLQNGNILIDQLLITGNGKNRFLELNINDGDFVLTSAKNVNADHFYRQLTSSELKKNKSLLDHSILSSRQISMVLRGCVI